MIQQFMPHGHCYFWDPLILTLHVGSDVIIGLSYYSIPVALAYFARQRPDIPHRWLFCAFALFILSCGTGHLFDVFTVWNPYYLTEGIIKSVTAAVSLAVAVIMWVMMPKILCIPSVQQFRESHEEVERLRYALIHSAKWRQNLAFEALEASRNGDKETFEAIVRKTLRNIGRVQLASDDYDIFRIDMELSQIVSDQCENFNINHTNIEPGIYGKGAPEKVKQAIKEILCNAVESGDPDPMVKLRRYGNVAVLTVLNRGKIDLNNKIFAAYYTTKEAHDGLGLTLAKSVAQKHGGDVQIKNIAGFVETTMRIRI